MRETQLGPTPIRPVIQYEPKGVEVPEGMRVLGWVNADNLDAHLNADKPDRSTFPIIWPNECFHAQVPVMVPVEEE